MNEQGVHRISSGSAYAVPTKRFVRASDLRKTAVTLLRYKWVVLGSIALALIIMTSIILISRPQFTAKLDLVLENSPRAVFDLTGPESERSHGEAELYAELFNEVVVLESRGLAKRVIDQLRLDEDPEFNHKLRPKGLVSSFIAEHISRRNRYDDKGAYIVNEFLDCLDVRNIPRARALEVSFTSYDPQKAASILGTLADIYIKATLDSKFDNVQRASVWLTDRVEKLRTELQRSEKAIEDYRTRHNLFQDDGSTLIARQMADVNVKLMDAKMERIAAEANFGEAWRLLNSPDSLGTTAVQVLQSDLIRRFREQELELDRKAADMAEQYGARHPAMVQIQAQRQELRHKIRDEIQRITKSLENQVRIAQTREASLARDLEVLKSKETQSNQASLGLRALERNAEANRLILQKMMASSIEAAAQNDIASQVPNVRVVSAASVPERPSFPRPLVLLPVSLLAGTVLGVVLAFALEKWQIGFRSAEETELATGLPVLAHVPSVNAGKIGRESISEYLQKRPMSAFAEAIRALYMRLILIRKHSAAGVVLVVSAQAEEGKTTICTSLARQHAQRGQRAVVLDADFRRSSLAMSAGLEPSPGLSELLVGTVELKDALQQDLRSAAHFIVAGKHWVDSGLLVSGRLKEIVGELRRSYDLIIIDSAPISAISDALVIAHIADVIIMTVRWGRTPQGVICSVLNQIMAAGRKVDGIVLSMVRVSELRSYEYGNYGKTAKYYTASAEQRVRLEKTS